MKKPTCGTCSHLPLHLPPWLERARAEGWTESDDELRAKIEGVAGCVLWEVKHG
jgi:hypothetical protein